MKIVNNLLQKQINEIFEINKFNIFSDEENYYFFRALNMGDNSDIENGITLD